MCCLEKLFEPNPITLDCFHAIPFVNCQYELARTVKNDVRYVHSLVLGVRSSGDVGKLKKFFNGGEYGRYRVSWIVDCLLDNVFTVEELVGNQLTVVVLEMSQHVRAGVFDRIGRAVANIRKVRLLDRGKFFQHDILLHYHQILEQTQSLGV